MNPGLLLRKVTFKLKAMQDGRLPDTGRAAWGVVKRRKMKQAAGLRSGQPRRT